MCYFFIYQRHAWRLLYAAPLPCPCRHPHDEHVKSREDPLLGRAKDVAAGAVLLCAIAAVAIGVLILGPPLLALLA